MTQTMLNKKRVCIVNFNYDTASCIAEGGGFEPPVPLRVRQFSKLLVSATHPSFLKQHELLS